MQKEKNEVSKRISQENNGGLPIGNGRVEENANRLKERSRTHEVAYGRSGATLSKQERAEIEQRETHKYTKEQDLRINLLEPIG